MGEVADALASYLAKCERPTEMAGEEVEATRSNRSWLERLSRMEGTVAPVVAPPKVSAPPIVTEETGLHRAEQDTRPHSHKPATVHHRRSKKRYYPLIVALIATAATLTLVMIFAFSGGVRDTHEQSAKHQNKSAASSRQETSGGLTVVDGKRVPTPLVAWNEAAVQAKALAAEQRFGEAVQQYKSLPGLAEDAVLRQRVENSVTRIEAQAAQAYFEAEGRARRLLADKKYADARSTLQPVIDRYGILQHVEAA